MKSRTDVHSLGSLPIKFPIVILGQEVHLLVRNEIVVYFRLIVDRLNEVQLYMMSS